MIIIEMDGVLYRGADRNRPSEVWNYPAKRWAPYYREWEPGWGTEVGKERAEILKFNSPGAAHYMYYDTPPWSRPLGETYHAAITPPRVAAAIEARRRAKGRAK